MSARQTSPAFTVVVLGVITLLWSQEGALQAKEKCPPASFPERNASGIVFDRFDPGFQARDAIGPDLATMLYSRLVSETPFAPDPRITLAAAMDVISAEMRDLALTGQLDRLDRTELGAFLTLTVLQVVVERHPQAEQQLLEGTLATSPVEDFCSCDKGGSRACGCTVVSTGSGDCEYQVACPSFGTALCSATNFEACLVKVIGDVISPFKLGDDIRK